MILRLKVIEGQRKDEEFSIKGEIKIGRARAQTDLTINDSKASGEHSRIFIKDNKFYYIEDLNSSNGTYINGQKITLPQELKLGDIITVGRTHFEIIELELGEFGFAKDSWQFIVGEALGNVESKGEKISSPNSDFGYFKQPVCLEVIKGAPLRTRYVFSFGPRTIGLHSPDAPIFHRGFPERAFELVPRNEVCTIVTSIKDLTLNSKPVTSATLKDGDVISVGQIEFIVKFLSL